MRLNFSSLLCCELWTNMLKLTQSIKQTYTVALARTIRHKQTFQSHPATATTTIKATIKSIPLIQIQNFSQLQIAASVNWLSFQTPTKSRTPRKWKNRRCSSSLSKHISARRDLSLSIDITIIRRVWIELNRSASVDFKSWVNTMIVFFFLPSLVCRLGSWPLVVSFLRFHCYSPDLAVCIFFCSLSLSLSCISSASLTSPRLQRI